MPFGNAVGLLCRNIRLFGRDSFGLQPFLYETLGIGGKTYENEP